MRSTPLPRRPLATAVAAAVTVTVVASAIFAYGHSQAAAPPAPPQATPVMVASVVEVAARGKVEVQIRLPDGFDPSAAWEQPRTCAARVRAR